MARQSAGVRVRLSPQPIGYDRTCVSAARVPGVLQNAMQIRAQEMIQSNQTRKEADHAE
jgi:hypothetical protein